jgi:cytosine/creatinine deaminase
MVRPVARSQEERMSELLLRGGRPWRFAGPADVLVRDGVIARIEPDIDAPGAEVFDVSGRLVLPGLVEAHCHLDKTLYGRAWEPHTAGDTLADRIGNERRRRGELGLPNADCAAALLERMVTAGTSYVRTHTDVYPGAGLGGVEAVRDAVRRLGGRVTVEQVAFPQHGILSTPGTAELLDEALKLGVETIGGIDPAGMDRDPVRHLDVVLGLAERHGAGIDIHLHDGGMLGAFELELITERTRASGLVGKVTVSHAYAFGQIDAAYQDRWPQVSQQPGLR